MDVARARSGAAGRHDRSGAGAGHVRNQLQAGADEEMMLPGCEWRPFAPWGEGAPKRRMRGPLPRFKQLPPHRFGRITYGRAGTQRYRNEDALASASQGLTPGSPRGEATAVSSNVNRLTI